MVRNKHYIPKQGDLVWVNFSPQSGHEQAGKRPAVVISPKIYNARAGLAIMCPITHQVKGYPFEVTLDTTKKVKGAILADQIKSLDYKRRKVEFIESLSFDVLREVVRKIQLLISLRQEQ